MTNRRSLPVASRAITSTAVAVTGGETTPSRSARTAGPDVEVHDLRGAS